MLVSDSRTARETPASFFEGEIHQQAPLVSDAAQHLSKIAVVVASSSAISSLARAIA